MLNRIFSLIFAITIMFPIGLVMADDGSYIVTYDKSRNLLIHRADHTLFQIDGGIGLIGSYRIVPDSKTINTDPLMIDDHYDLSNRVWILDIIDNACIGQPNLFECVKIWNSLHDLHVYFWVNGIKYKVNATFK